MSTTGIDTWLTLLRFSGHSAVTPGPCDIAVNDGSVRSVTHTGDGAYTILFMNPTDPIKRVYWFGVRSSGGVALTCNLVDWNADNTECKVQTYDADAQALADADEVHMCLVNGESAFFP